MTEEEFQEQQELIAILRGNPYKFLDHVYLQDSDLGIGHIKFQKWPHLMDLLHSFMKHRFHIVLKARKIGLTSLIAAYCDWIALYHRNAKVLILSQGEKESTDVLKDKCKYIYDNLPVELQPTKGTDNFNTFGFKGLGEIQALPATENAGRSADASLIVLDEFDFHPNAEINLRALMPIVTRGNRSMIIVSTIAKSKPDSPFKKIYKDATEGKNDFIPHFYSPFVIPGQDEKWYEAITRNMSQVDVEQEFPRTAEEALSPLSARSFFNKETLDRLLASAIEPFQVRSPGIYIMHPPKPGTIYVAGGDIGEGIKEDYSALCIIGRFGGQSEVCALVYTNEINTDTFAYYCHELLKEYFWPLVAIENNGLGLAVLNKLVEMQTKGIFYEAKDRKKAGVAITSSPYNQKRLAFLSELRDAVDNSSLITRFRPQILEFMDFQWKEAKGGGNLRPEGGKHDDLVFSCALANQMLKHCSFMEKIQVHHYTNWRG